MARGSPVDNDKMLDQALKCLDATEVVSFSADPDELAPGRSQTTVSWNVKTATGCNRLSIQLNGLPVARKGQRTFTQLADQTYALTARLLSVNSTLRRLTVRYDTSRCVQLNLSEDQIRAAIGRELATVLTSDKKVTLRQDPRIEVTSRGVEVSLRIGRKIDDFPDLKVAVDFVLAFSVDDGQPVVRYRSFSLDTDWPWWVTTLSGAVTKIVEEVIDDKIEGKLKPRILDAVRDQIRAMAAGFPRFRLHSIVTRTDEVHVEVCPTS